MSGSRTDSACRLARRLLHLLAGGALLIALGAAFSSCNRRDTAAEKRNSAEDNSVLRVSQMNEPDDLDPALAAIPDDGFIIRALSEGLVSPSPDGHSVVPAAAEHWVISEDGLTYTFHLRKGAQWSDGSPVVSSDFLSSYRRLLTPSTAAPKAHLFYPVKGARAFHNGSESDFSTVGFAAPDPLRLVIQLRRATPRFLMYVASAAWIPVNPRCVEARGKDWTKPGNFVGNGPYLLTEWQAHRRIVVKRRPGYWDTEHVRLESIQFLSFDNKESEERAFRAGQLDVTMSVPTSKLEVYANASPSVLQQAPLQEIRYLSFNTLRPPLNDPRVRRALALAINREALTSRVLQGGQTAAKRFLPPLLSPRGTLQGVATDATASRQELAAAGFPGGKNFPRLELSGWTNIPVLEALQEMWKKVLGIEVVIATRDAKVHVAALREGKYDIGLITAIPDAADPFLLLADYVPNAAGNYPHWKSETYERSLEAASLALDAGERDQWLIAAESVLLREAPLTPLYINTRSYLVRPEVKDWQEDGLWNRFYKGVRIEAKH